MQVEFAATTNVTSSLHLEVGSGKKAISVSSRYKNVVM